MNRTLQCYFPSDTLNYLKEHLDCETSIDANLTFTVYDPFESKAENICNHLANELIDYGLINARDHGLITDLLLKSIKDFVLSLVKQN